MNAEARVHHAAWNELAPATLHDILKVRIDVFVVEQQCPYPELDGRDADPATRHWWVASGGQIAAVLRVLVDGEAWRIGRVCTARAFRGKGLARTLMEAALQSCSDRAVVLDAQTYLEDWYAQLGFTRTGPDFLDDGIPHLPMRREPA